MFNIKLPKDTTDEDKVFNDWLIDNIEKHPKYHQLDSAPINKDIEITSFNSPDFETRLNHEILKPQIRNIVWHLPYDELFKHARNIASYYPYNYPGADDILRMTRDNPDMPALYNQFLNKHLERLLRHLDPSDKEVKQINHLKFAIPKELNSIPQHFNYLREGIEHANYNLIDTLHDYKQQLNLSLSTPQLYDMSLRKEKKFA